MYVCMYMYKERQWYDEKEIKMWSPLKINEKKLGKKRIWEEWVQWGNIKQK